MSGPDVPRADALCEGGDLDCGSGLLLLIRQAMQPLAAGQVLEVRSRESSVRVDLPAWCRLVGHALLSEAPAGAGGTSFFIRKKGEADAELAQDRAQARAYTWSVRVRAGEGMSARCYVRNHAFTVGQPASFDTSDAAPSAVEYLLGALAGCLAVGLRWRASRRGVELRELEVTLKARADNVLVYLGLEDEGHPGLERVEGRVFVDSDADDAALEALWNETVARSPVAQTVARPIPLSIERRSL